ncbi:MAG: UDP-4-amino-4,6-dideoxy-N-acetyl-beta-L-altrosamine transaminase [Desulfobulbaceae bacterium]|nr:UDP-4-amino-4,6-dideoxy-N-acetyl-beta-L-altrosamine transaminase [Desulfobulbaceae bacterium]
MNSKKNTIKHSFLPYGCQSINEDDIAAVVAALRSDWLTTGPLVGEFEKAVADFCGVRYGVAVSSGTAALHAAMAAIGIGLNDEVIIPAMTFAATANAVVYQGGQPVFADVEADTLLIDPVSVEALISKRTKAIVAVDYAGQPCDYPALRAIAEKYGLWLVADACHSLGAEYGGKKVGTLADCTVFSFHPVKHITTGEGGMVVTDNPELAEAMRRFRNHGISTDHRQREASGTWQYEMVELGYNYRITDFQCALGVSQLSRLPTFIDSRRRIASHYSEAFSPSSAILPLAIHSEAASAWHLYVVRLLGNISREAAFRQLRERGIGVNVHYLPVYLHPFYQRRFATRLGLCPVAEAAYATILSLPIWPGMTEEQVHRVCETLALVVSEQVTSPQQDVSGARLVKP